MSHQYIALHLLQIPSSASLGVIIAININERASLGCKWARGTKIWLCAAGSRLLSYFSLLTSSNL